MYLNVLTLASVACLKNKGEPSIVTAVSKINFGNLGIQACVLRIEGSSNIKV